MASNKKKPQPADETLEQQEDTQASEKNEGGETNADTAEEETVAEDNDPSAESDPADELVDETEGADSGESNLTAPSEQPATPGVTDLHDRLTKAARALSTNGQEKHFAVHQLEHLTGKLKMVLPAGIAAVEDQELKAGLETLLGLL